MLVRDLADMAAQQSGLHDGHLGRLDHQRSALGPRRGGDRHAHAPGGAAAAGRDRLAAGVGATPLDIAVQFLLEGMTLATLGVLAGLGLGLLAQAVASRWSSVPLGFDATLPAIAALVSLGVSVAACLVPAVLAARLEPAAALRP